MNYQLEIVNTVNLNIDLINLDPTKSQIFMIFKSSFLLYKLNLCPGPVSQGSSQCCVDQTKYVFIVKPLSRSSNITYTETKPECDSLSSVREKIYW